MRACVCARARTRVQPVPRRCHHALGQALQTGLGGASCGPIPLEKYILRAQPFDYTYILRPCRDRSHAALSALARQP